MKIIARVIANALEHNPEIITEILKLQLRKHREGVMHEILRVEKAAQDRIINHYAIYEHKVKVVANTDNTDVVTR